MLTLRWYCLQIRLFHYTQTIFFFTFFLLRFLAQCLFQLNYSGTFCLSFIKTRRIFAERPSSVSMIQCFTQLEMPKCQSKCFSAGKKTNKHLIDKLKPILLFSIQTLNFFFFSLFIDYLFFIECVFQFIFFLNIFILQF